MGMTKWLRAESGKMGAAGVKNDLFFTRGNTVELKTLKHATYGLQSGAKSAKSDEKSEEYTPPHKKSKPEKMNRDR